MEGFTPKKLCFKIEPPTIVLFYQLDASGKLHRRSIPIRNLNEKSRVAEIIKDLYNTHHGKYLKKIPEKQLHKLLSKLHSQVYGNDDASRPGPGIAENENFNRLGDDDLNKVKDKMSVSFEKNRVKPGDENWKYDVEIDFEENGGNKIESGWDSDESDNEF